jgi:diacylglycerol kinase family enzyme
LSAIVRTEAQRVLVVANPTAGSHHRREAIEGLSQCLRNRGLAPQVVYDLAALPELCARHRAAGTLRAVIACGGDGTVAEVVNRTTAEVPITVYPLGTANLLAGYLEIRAEPQAMADIVAAGALARFDAGLANGRIFVLVASCGFDADVVERLHRLRSGGHSSYWKWARPIWSAMRSYDFPDLRVDAWTADGEHCQQLDVRWAFVVNLPPYAVGLQFAPRARPADGMLDVCTFRRGSFWHAVRYLSYMWLHWHHALPDYQTARVRRVRIASDRSVPYQLDGDPGGQLPLEIEVLPSRLTILASARRLTALDLERIKQSTAGAT